MFALAVAADAAENNIEIYTWKETGNLSWGSRHKKHVYVESLKFSIFIPFSQAKRICIKYSIAHKVATAKFHFSYVFSLNECMNFCSICLLKLIIQNKKNNARSPSLVKIKGNKENVDFIEIFFSYVVELNMFIRTRQRVTRRTILAGTTS